VKRLNKKKRFFVSSRARRKERFSFFARKQVLELHSSRQRRGGKKDERFFNLSDKT
jgi:hypothetical protein